jgi:hypothetical protein
MARTPSYHIFISYRREDGKHLARILKESLVGKGYRVFLDLDELQDGVFDEHILDAIDASPIFMLLMTEHCFDRCETPNDWVRQEIEYAIKRGKTIIPINIDKQFEHYPVDMPKHIQQALSAHQYSAIDTGQLFQESVDKLVRERIRPVVGFKHKAIVWALVLFFVTLVPYAVIYYAILPKYYVYKGDQALNKPEPTTEDTLDAIKFYEYAIKVGNLEGYAKIGDVYYASALAQDIENSDIAYSYYQQGAYAGDGYAMTRYALCLKEPCYVDVRPLESPDSAFYWANRAYTTNAPQAANTLAEFYAAGYGVNRDVMRAIELYKEGLECGEYHHGLGNTAVTDMSLGLLLKAVDYVEGTSYLVDVYLREDAISWLFISNLKYWLKKPQVDNTSTGQIQLNALSWDTKGRLRLHLEWFNTKFQGGWMQIDSSAFVENALTKERYRVSALENCKFSPDTTQVAWGKSNKFTLIFDQVPDTIQMLNFCESDTSQWKLYGIHLEDKVHIKSWFEIDQP